MDGNIDHFVKILESSNYLNTKIPYVRKLSLIETLKSVSNTDQANNIFLENLCTSPYIQDEHKYNFADLVLSEQWSTLYNLLDCVDNNISNDTIGSFREMVITIFTKSKKIAVINEERKRQLGIAILAQTSIDSLKTLAFTALETSEAFDNDTREIIANDIIDNRYDLLLLPNRFDCEEIPRNTHEQINNNTNELDECPICLGANEVDTKLPCNHLFCRSCIESWSNQNNECPLCRRTFLLNQLESI